MTAIELELPSDVEQQLGRLGVENSSLPGWIVDAVRLKLSAVEQRRYFEERAARGNRDAFERAMAKVPAVLPHEEDQI